MKRFKKPTIDEILALYGKCEEYYAELFKVFDRDEQFYELDFKKSLGIPEEFKDEGVVLPTGRDVADSFVDHIDLSNARVSVNRKGISGKAEEEAETEEKFYLGLIHMTNVESSISPWRVGGKHYVLYGECVFRTLWEADRWPDKPIQKADESDEDYNARLVEWELETRVSLPIHISAINPANIMPDPEYGGELYVFETREKWQYNAKELWPHWTNPKGRGTTEAVKCISFYSKHYRSELVDGEPILRVGGGVAPNTYGFIPYTIIESGLGNLAKDSKPEKRYVGILRYITDLLLSESRDYSVADVLLKREAWRGGYVTGPGSNAVADVSQKYGEWTPVPEGTEFHDWTEKLPPEMLNYHLARTADYIASHAAPRSVRGLSEMGVRSAIDRRQIIAEAGARYRYCEEAFRYGTAKVLTNCALLLKNVINGDVRVWARTPLHAFDTIISKDKMKEPFTCSVEFAPVSEEDEYRRHDDLRRSLLVGLITKPWARGQMPNVDPLAMELEEEIEKLRNDPNLQAVIAQYAVAKLAQAISSRAGAEAITAMPLPSAQPMPGIPGQQTPQTMGSMVPGFPERARAGSAEEMQRMIQELGGGTPAPPTQGLGGGRR